jgi:hypothetical protein
MWDASEWLCILSAEAQLVWVKLLCYAKGHGFDGRVKAINPIVAARMWNVGDESVRQLLKAAEIHGLLSNGLSFRAMEAQNEPDGIGKKRSKKVTTE